MVLWAPKRYFETVTGAITLLENGLDVSEKVDDYWEPAKKQLLADAKGFMDSLVKFDKDNIPDRIINKVGN